MSPVHPAPAQAEGPIDQLLGAALSRNMGPRLRRLLTTYAVAGAGYKVAKTVYDRAESWRTHTVSVRARDDIYADVHAWLLDRIPDHKRKSLTARSQRVVGELVAVPESPGSVARQDNDGDLTVLYDGRRQRVSIDGHPVWVHINKPEFSYEWLKEDNYSRMSDHEEIVFSARSPAGRNAVLEFLRTVSENHYRQERAPSVFLGSRWGDWRRRRGTPGRDLASVVLSAGRKEELVADLADFLTHEDEYGRLGVPWHRGYLFEGPPGTGKSSLAMALSTHFSMDIYYVPLSDLESDNYLMQLVANVEPRSILLLEDIDVVHAARDRADDSQGVTSAGLLNAVDGVMAGHGVVSIMTTNDSSQLDEALLRPGRVDRREHIGYVDDDQVDRLVIQFLGASEFTLPAVRGDVAPAAVIEVFKRHLGDPDGALVELKELLDG